MRYRGLARAFSLIEAMIVVAIVGILAVLAVVAYQRWIRTAYIAEAHDMISNIRSAEESYRAENGAYLDVSAALGVGNLYPASRPGAFKTAWGGPCGNCANSNPNLWSVLTIESKGPLAFGYAVVAPPAPLPGITIDSAPVSLSNLVAPWYVVQAMGDINGNGVFTSIYALSTGGPLLVDNEGE
jgi:prepilin-type N-terminal cleavage/methylation domain-containing protein